MARVFIPQPMRKLTNGQLEAQIPGKNLREVVENLEKEFPGATEYILKDGALKPGIAAIVGEQATRQGLLHKIDDPETEVHFLPAIAGG
ncbi:MAG: molybdopterin synthase sulfur carrier subunit [Chloroflexi bacterium]|jgi:molybdopterin converting factor small subunit|nr:molybdopterin synthase sulfur carrier subunit [Chloroflexota bacterium]MBT4074654.1 molybdopterin synthase sulfur carrier subunit [Chloroflexota bacterium]MBT4515846.1 molybdopterin synthase sulfur carrier subunit [Chloroflexota bacterium]MBT5320293.1 molybdopterin synthase sulfur carrier subunit [Chloroflexota bacterium]MBT6683053.1 molybdopterin synthase sulfur carrier subunit [Chloroflexota bacterium]